MKRPTPPWLELSFYFGDEPEHHSFLRLLTFLQRIGTRLNGDVRVHHGEGVRTSRLSAIYGEGLFLEEASSLQDIRALLHQSNRRVIQVGVYGASGISDASPEVVTYVGISNDAAFPRVGRVPAWQRRHPLAIQTEGALFCTALHDDSDERVRKTGGQVSERFLAIVESLDPWYATLAVDWDLECPRDLMFDPRSFAFANCYVSGRVFGLEALEKLSNIYSRTFSVAIGQGLYFSCMSAFNRDSASVAPLAMQEMAVSTGRLLAETLARRRTPNK